MWVRKMMALALLPLNMVQQTIQNIIAVTVDPAAVQFLQYFQNQWLVTCPIQMWNVCREDVRTNNGVEGKFY